MLTDFFEDFVLQDKVTASDGFGGIKESYTDGAAFKAGISLNNSNEAQLEYRRGLTRVYTVVTPETTVLHQNDRIKRIKNGMILRVMTESADMKTPSTATVKYAQVSAEVIV